MKVLLTNDDGFDSPGIRVLVDAAIQLGWEVTVVVPSGQMSGTSRSRQSGQMIRYSTSNLNGCKAFRVEGTPAECVLFALCAPGFPSFDACISGVNAGENLGADLAVSGTFGAAVEGWAGGIRSCALSREYGGRATTDPWSWDWDSTTETTVLTLDWLFGQCDWTLANVNIPNASLLPPEVCVRSNEPYFHYSFSPASGSIESSIETSFGQLKAGDDISCFLRGVVSAAIIEKEMSSYRRQNYGH